MTRQIAVAATAPFGADVLERLAESREVSALLTRPDAPAGRGRKPSPPPAKEAAERLGITVLQPDELRAGLELGAQTVVAVAYGRIVPETLLEERLWLNVHPSRLPRWRGAAPVERALMAGDTETGVTIIELVKELDAGPIAAQRSFPIEADDDAGSIYAKSASVAVELLDEVLDEPPREYRPQPDEGVTYADKIEARDRALDLTRPPEELVNRSERSRPTSARARSCKDAM